MKKVLVMDASILCVWLGVSGRETCGPTDDPWDKRRVDQRIKHEQGKGTLFVLPLASLIETGNLITQSRGNRYAEAKRLAELLAEAADGRSPWAAFTQQSALWDGAALSKLSKTWPALAAQRLSIGDATIEEVARFYERMGHEVEILTGDRGLKAREPARQLVPRRRGA